MNREKQIDEFVSYALSIMRDLCDKVAFAETPAYVMARAIPLMKIFADRQKREFANDVAMYTANEVLTLVFEGMQSVKQDDPVRYHNMLLAHPRFELLMFDEIKHSSTHR